MDTNNLTLEDVHNIKTGLFVNHLKVAEIKDFIEYALTRYGTTEKLEEANKVLNVMIGMLKKKKQLRTLDEAAVWIDVVIAAGLIHNLFYDGSISSLFKAREVLTDKAKEYKVPDNAISAMFQTVECQLGDDTPIPGCIPVSSTPNELFAWSCWFVKEYEEV